MSEPTKEQRAEAERLLSDVYDYCSDTGSSWSDPTEIVLALIVELDEARETTARITSASRGYLLGAVSKAKLERALGGQR